MYVQPFSGVLSDQQGICPPVPAPTSFTLLFNLHRRGLLAKQVDSESQLQNILDWDFAKILHALLEMQSVDVDQVLLNFFADHASTVPEVLANVTDHRLNHLGFEIYAPLDLLLNEFDHWPDKLGRMLGQRVKIIKLLRFPASPAFQQRVGAAAEIMSVWARVGKQRLMLELFDIARPLDAVLPRVSVDLDCYARDSVQRIAAQHAQAMTGLFQNDKIWHYAIHVANRQTVEHLHQAFQTLMAEHPHYKLAYATPVENRYDGSFHTKIINLKQSLELEFATHERLRSSSSIQ